MAITETPWGRPDWQREIAHGVTVVATPSHGGYYLDSLANALVPAPIRIASGWYEEDCDWSRVALAFPALFPPDALPLARVILREYAPRAAALFLDDDEIPPSAEAYTSLGGGDQ